MKISLISVLYLLIAAMRVSTHLVSIVSRARLFPPTPFFRHSSLLLFRLPPVLIRFARYTISSVCLSRKPSLADRSDPCFIPNPPLVLNLTLPSIHKSCPIPHPDAIVLHARRGEGIFAGGDGERAIVDRSLISSLKLNGTLNGGASCQSLTNGNHAQGMQGQGQEAKKRRMSTGGITKGQVLVLRSCLVRRGEEEVNRSSGTSEAGGSSVTLSTEPQSQSQSQSHSQSQSSLQSVPFQSYHPDLSIISPTANHNPLVPSLSSPSFASSTSSASVSSSKKIPFFNRSRAESKAGASPTDIPSTPPHSNSTNDKCNNTRSRSHSFSLFSLSPSQWRHTPPPMHSSSIGSAFSTSPETPHAPHSLSSNSPPTMGLYRGREQGVRHPGCIEEDKEVEDEDDSKGHGQGQGQGHGHGSVVAACKNKDRICPTSISPSTSSTTSAPRFIVKPDCPPVFHTPPRTGADGHELDSVPLRNCCEACLKAQELGRSVDWDPPFSPSAKKIIEREALERENERLFHQGGGHDGCGAGAGAGVTAEAEVGYLTPCAAVRQAERVHQGVQGEVQSELECESEVNVHPKEGVVVDEVEKLHKSEDGGMAHVQVHTHWTHEEPEEESEESDPESRQQVKTPSPPTHHHIHNVCHNKKKDYFSAGIMGLKLM